MSKSKFAESLQGLSSEQFDRVAADMLAEAGRRGNTSSDWTRVGTMNDTQFEQFKHQAFADVENAKARRDLEAAAARSGKTLADPKAADDETGEAGDA